MIGIVLLFLLLIALGTWWLSAEWDWAVRGAIRNLMLHKLRSFLSVLGIVVGTASVIVLMGFGEGSMRDALADIERQGAMNIYLVSTKPSTDGRGGRQTVSRYGLTYEDHARLAETLSPAVRATLPMRIFAADVRMPTSPQAYGARIVATQARYADLFHLSGELAMGRFLTDADDRDSANVAILGAEAATSLFHGNNPLGQNIRIKDRSFEVVGVLREGARRDTIPGDVFIPLRAWRERIGQLAITPTHDSFVAEDVPLSEIILTTSHMDEVHYVAELVRTQLRQYHPQGDVELRIPLDRLEEAKRTRNRYRILLFFIAGISLVVGGIGIMNIMLATVTERTREIGIRRAMGAAQQDIALQFLIEAIVQTSLGGLIGVIAGFSLLFAIPQLYLLWQQYVVNVPALLLNRVPVQLNFVSVVLALGVALAVGVAFGWYPARRAALLDPIEALRHE